MEVGRHGAGNTGWSAKRWSHRERVSDVRKKKEGEARGRKRKPRERERRIAERKREREKHVEKAIEDTVKKEGRRGTDMKSQGSRWFFAMKGKRGDHSE